MIEVNTILALIFGIKMINNEETKAADKMLKDISASLKKDPTNGMSIFVDLLSAERLRAHGILQKFISCSVASNILLLALVAYLANPEVETKVVQKGKSGELREVATSDSAYYELQEIKDFAYRRAVAIHTWGYGNYRQVFQNEKKFWDKEPIETYIDTLVEQEVFDLAKQTRRRFTAVAASQIDVLQEMNYNGNYKMYRVTFDLKDESVDIVGVDSKVWSVTIDIRETLPSESAAGLKVARYDEVVKTL